MMSSSQLVNRRTATERGFHRLEMQDARQSSYYVQESSLATQQAVWLGYTDADAGWAAHLSRRHAAGVAVALACFAITGQICGGQLVRLLVRRARAVSTQPEGTADDSAVGRPRKPTPYLTYKKRTHLVIADLYGAAFALQEDEVSEAPMLSLCALNQEAAHPITLSRGGAMQLARVLGYFAVFGKL